MINETDKEIISQQLLERVCSEWNHSVYLRVCSKQAIVVGPDDLFQHDVNGCTTDASESNQANMNYTFGRRLCGKLSKKIYLYIIFQMLFQRCTNGFIKYVTQWNKFLNWFSNTHILLPLLFEKWCMERKVLFVRRKSVVIVNLPGSFRLWRFWCFFFLLAKQYIISPH